MTYDLLTLNVCSVCFSCEMENSGLANFSEIEQSGRNYCDFSSCIGAERGRNGEGIPPANKLRVLGSIVSSPIADEHEFQCFLIVTECLLLRFLSQIDFL